MSALLLMQATDMIPRPPDPSSYEKYGFPGIIFGAFVSVITVVLVLGWKYITARDASLMLQQDKRDASFAEALRSLSTDHKEAVARIAGSVEKAGDLQTAALRELSREVQQDRQVLSEDRLLSLFRRVMSELRGEIPWRTKD